MTDIETASSIKRMLWVGIGGALIAVLAGMFGTHDGSIWRLPRALQAQVGAALQSAGLGGVDVAMNGQTAILRGIVPDAAATARATSAALHAAGAGGPWAGGVTHVDASGLNVGDMARPFAWSVSRQGERVVLSGAVSSEAARADLTAIATAQFPNAEIVDHMRIAGGAPSSNWSEMAGNVVRSVAVLREGEGRITDAEVALIGDGDYAAVDRLRTAYATPPAPFHARVAASVDGLDLTYPELQGIDLREISPNLCSNAFARLLDDGGLGFETGSAAMTSQGRATAEALTSVALRCDRYRLTVLGPQDGGGELSRARASGLADYMRAQGVVQARAAAGSGRALAIAVDAAEAGQP